MKDFRVKPNKKPAAGLKTSAQRLLELSGSWDDDRSAEEIIAEIRQGRTRRIESETCPAGE